MENKFKFISNPSEQISSIKDYIYGIFSNWYWFVFSVIIAFLIAFYYNISTEKIYGLKTTIAVKEKQNPLFATGTRQSLRHRGVCGSEVFMF